jgi:small GTP-binding protein
MPRTAFKRAIQSVTFQFPRFINFQFDQYFPLIPNYHADHSIYEHCESTKSFQINLEIDFSIILYNRQSPLSSLRPFFPEMLKVVLVGDAGVGKTALWNCLIRNPITETSSTVSPQTVTIRQIVDGLEWTFVLWDTAGQEVYRSLVPMYFRGAHYVFLVFDLSNPGSYPGLQAWRALIEEHLPKGVPILIGNKSDLDIALTRDSVEKFRKEIKAPQSFYVSARSGEGVDSLLPFIARHARENEDPPTQTKESRKVDLKEAKEELCC